MPAPPSPAPPCPPPWRQTTTKIQSHFAFMSVTHCALSPPPLNSELSICSIRSAASCRQTVIGPSSPPACRRCPPAHAHCTARSGAICPSAYPCLRQPPAPTPRNHHPHRPPPQVQQQQQQVRRRRRRREQQRSSSSSTRSRHRKVFRAKT